MTTVRDAVKSKPTGEEMETIVNVLLDKELASLARAGGASPYLLKQCPFDDM